VVEDEERIANIVVPGSIVAELETTPVDGVMLERVSGQEQSHRFGLVETASVIGIAKGMLELIKLALEIRDKLRGSAPTQTARLSAPASPSWVELRASMTDTEIADAVRAHFV
jgi:hypothetical protein